MKNKIALFLIALVPLTYACGGGEQKSNEGTEMKADEAAKALTLKAENTSISFTAYKTTDKTPVKGEFQKVYFRETSGSNVDEVLNGLEFSIPISSLFTNDATNTRDAKITEFFFGAMMNTEALSGKIVAENGAYAAQIEMNGQTNNMPLEVKVSGTNEVVATGTMNLAEWDALQALASLNEVCFDLHKGADGVSKTWEDVAIEITAQLE